MSIAIKQINEPPGRRPAQLRPGHPARARGGRAARAGEGPGAALPERRGVHRRARGARAARRAAASPPEPAASRTSEPRLALVAVAAGAARARRARPSAPTSCSRGKKVDVPNVVGQRGRATPPTSLHQRGLEVAFMSEVSEDVPRDEVIAQDPAAGERGRGGHDGHAHVSAGRGRRRCPRSRAVERRRRGGAARRRLQGRRSRRRTRTPCRRAT